MPTLRIESPLVERVYQSDYVALAASLGEIGWTVVEPRRRYEERGGIPPRASLALEVAIHLGEAVAALGLEEIVRAVIANLRKPRLPSQTRRRQCVIYGPRQQVLARVDLDGPPDEDTDS